METSWLISLERQGNPDNILPPYREVLRPSCCPVNFDDGFHGVLIIWRTAVTITQPVHTLKV